jgi:polyisoprenoid-binding protein YceI
MSRFNHAVLMLGALVIGLIACGPAAIVTAPPIATAAAQPATTVAAQPTTAVQPAATDAAAATAAPAASGQFTLQLAPSGNEARYRVREQLANLALPSDAVGKTSAITGQLVIGADGTPVGAQSKIVVDITGLQSDSGMRDGYIQRAVLETAAYPTVEFVPTAVSGLPSPLPQAGDVTFQLTGDLTVHGTTKRVTWDVKATAANGTNLSGTAITHFSFADFGLQQPHVGRVLSIEDTIKLEFDFHFVKAG